MWVVHWGWKWRKTGTVRESVTDWQGVKAQARLQVPRVHQAQTRCAVEKKAFVCRLIGLTLAFL